MTENSSGRVSMTKPDLTDAAPVVERPSYVVWSTYALALSAVAALVTSLSLFGVKNWLLWSAETANGRVSAADYRTYAQLQSAVNTTIKGQLIATLIVALALGIAARAVWKGRYWSRWAVLGLWVLSTFTGTFAGFSYIITIGTSEPLLFKVPAFVSALAFVAAVIMTNLRQSTQYFALTRPVRVGPAKPRGGLFMPRDPTRAARRGGLPRLDRPGSLTSNAQARTDAVFDGDSPTERSRAKQRANAESVARGAQLARDRAKASKSRRTGV